MDELACLMDWDLEAIVRGYNGEAPAATTIGDPHPSFSPFFSQQDELLCSFPEFSETTNVLIDELQELYKPFNPVFQPLSSQTNVTSSLTIPKEVKELQASEKVALQVPIASKYKRSKKNQKKSVVKKVTTVDDGFCDEWAWRKYGQKPIKGSPYPRSYYRCSSSKGCLARKQVERNHLDPKVFLVTYTAEHNHPQPTRRNSLAGSTRKNNINSSAVTHSPRTPLVVVASSNVEDVFVTSRVQQSKGLEKEEDLLEWLDGVGDGDSQLGDGWIPSKELEEFIDGCSFTDGTFADI